MEILKRTQIPWQIYLLIAIEERSENGLLVIGDHEYKAQIIAYKRSKSLDTTTAYIVVGSMSYAITITHDTKTIWIKPFTSI
jgi:hypothetical protein